MTIIIFLPFNKILNEEMTAFSIYNVFIKQSLNFVEKDCIDIVNDFVDHNIVFDEK